MIKDKNKFNKEMLFVFIILYGIPAMIIIIPAIYFIIWPLIKVIVWPLIKIIWMLIALPFEAMTNINITGTEEIIHVHTDTTPLEFILEYWDHLWS